MSANVETMMYVRETPWHGLGVRVEEALTSAEAIRMAGLDWEVEKKPLFTEHGIEIPGYKANTRTSDKRVLGVVTDRYQIVQNADAFNFTDSLIDDYEMAYETAGSLREGKQIWLLGKMPKTQILGDDVEPYICFTNTHDGTGAIKVCMTPIRVVCNNTLNIALKTAKRAWSTRHVGDMESKLEEAKVTLGFAQKYLDELNITAEQYAEKKMSDAVIEQFIDDLFPMDVNKDSDRKKANVKQLRDNFKIAYFMPDIKQFRNTQWGLIQAATDFVGHNVPARQSEKYQENNWGRIMGGHQLVDLVTSKLAVIR